MTSATHFSNKTVIFIFWVLKSSPPSSFISKSLITLMLQFCSVNIFCESVPTFMSYTPQVPTMSSNNPSNLRLPGDLGYNVTRPTVYTTPSIPIENVIANAGTDVRLNCSKNHLISSQGRVAWIRHQSAKENHSAGGMIPKPFPTDPEDGSIMLTNLSAIRDEGIYTCTIAERKLKKIRLIVKSTPSEVMNLSVIPHSVYALVTWNMSKRGDGGYPILRYVLSYKLERSHLNMTGENYSDWFHGELDAMEGTSSHLYSEENHLTIPNDEYQWRVVDSNISPNATSKSVYNLRPNATYHFRLFAVNLLGNGKNVSTAVDTKYSIEEINEANRLWTEKGMASLYLKISIIVITVIIVTFAILGLGISLVVFRSCSCGKSTGLRHDGITCEATEDEEAMELVPHITLNPSFNIDMLEYLEAEESPTSDLQYPPSLNMSTVARVGTSAAFKAAASKAVTNVASVTPSGSNGIRKGSSLTDDQVNLVTIGQM